MVLGNSKKFLILVLKLAVSSLALYLISRKADMAQVFRLLQSIGPLTFMGTSAIYVIAQVFSAARWQLFLPDRYPLKRLFTLYMIGSFFSSFLPGIVGGDAVRAYYLNKDAKKISVTLAAVFMDRYFGFVTLMLIGITAFPFSLGVFESSPYKWLMPGLFIFFFAGSILFFVLKLGSRFRFMSDIYEYMLLFRSRKLLIFKAIAMSAVIQILGFIAVLILASKMGEHISLLLLAVFLPIVLTVVAMPISISGLGLREGAFVILLGLIGIDPEIATSLSLAWFFSTFVGCLPGLVFYIFHSRQKAA